MSYICFISNLFAHFFDALHSVARHSAALLDFSHDFTYATILFDKKLLQFDPGLTS